MLIEATRPLKISANFPLRNFFGISLLSAMKFLIAPLVVFTSILFFHACSPEAKEEAKELKENTQETLTKSAEGAKEDLSAAGEVIKEELEEAGEVVKDVSKSAAKGVVQTAEDVKIIGSEIGEGAKDVFQDVKERVNPDATPVPTATPAP